MVRMINRIATLALFVIKLAMLSLVLAPMCHAQDTAGIGCQSAKAAVERYDARRPDSTYWQTVEVLYGGVENIMGCTLFVCDGTNKLKPRHDWVDDEIRIIVESGDTFRNRICRNCLRHERQVERVYAPPVPHAKTSEYDSLLKVLEKR